MADVDRIYLCGPLVATLEGRDVGGLLQGPQARLAFAYLILNRDRDVERERLVGALWPDRLPADPDTALSAILSKMRKVLGPAELTGRSVVRIVLPAGTWIDIDAATEAMHRAEGAISRGLHHEAWSPARVTLHITRRGFLRGLEGPWIDAERERVNELYLRSLECYGESCLGIGGTEIDGARRCGRALVSGSPYRESGYRILMRALEVEGNPAEALRVYESLRTKLRDELGVSPGPETQQVHQAILTRGAAI